MKAKIVSVILTVSMAVSLLAGCGGAGTAAGNAGTGEASEASAESGTTEEIQASETGEDQPEAKPSEETEDPQEKADKVAELIDAIYVQQWTPETEEQCRAAKEAWDKLTDEEKELVEGEFADPDYFGRDTGDASKDDPLNQDGIGENEILVVSFGTSFNDSRTATIGGIERALIEAFPDWSVRRAFTAQIIINHILARDNENIDNVEQALQRAKDNGVKNLIIQPTHLMHGAEYDELSEAVEAHSGDFEKVVISEPLLGEASDDAAIVNEDKKAVAEALAAEAAAVAGFDSVDDADKKGTAFVFLGHGTSHKASVAYDQMNTQMKELGYGNVFIGTVEGEPEDTECTAVMESINEKGYKNVIMRPLMVVAGDHANNDMAGDDDDSWKSVYAGSGYFDSIDFQIAGLGEIGDIQKIYTEHAKKAIDGAGIPVPSADKGGGDTALPDGTYEAVFKTDNSMFHVNEACDDKGTLTVKDGKMTIHVSLASKNIVELFPGTADKAEAGAETLKPTTDTVEYPDGSTEEVYGFDVPVPALDQDFDLALLGKKGKWYDHKVSVSKAE